MFQANKKVNPSAFGIMYSDFSKLLFLVIFMKKEN